MRKFLYLLIVLPSYAQALNLTGAWATDNYKMARQDFYPGGASTNTLTRIWDGNTIKPFGGRGEEVGFGVYLLNGSTATATSVNLQISSFTGPSGFGIVPVPRLLSGTTVFNTPVEVFVSTYVQIKGLTRNAWDPSEYEERDLPPNFRNPYTVNVNNDGGCNGSCLWTTRPDRDKYYPDALVPLEAYASSSFTVAASSSQLVWVDVYVDSSLPSGVYNSTITVTEGAAVSMRLPVSILVYNFILPAKPAFTVIADRSISDIGFRHGQGTFCGTLTCDTLEQHYDQMLHHHKIIPIGDDNLSHDYLNNTDYPRFTGNLYNATSGYFVGPGIGQPDTVYSIGTYGSWQGSWSGATTIAANLCSHVSNWESYFANNFNTVRSFLYLTDEPVSLTQTNQWSTWMSTMPACQVLSYKTHRFVTNNWTSVNTGAPNVDMPASTGWINAASTTWQTVAAVYETTGDTQAWAYNGHPGYWGTMFATEDSGISPLEEFWADWGKGVQGHFLWESTYWKDTNETGQNNPLWTDAKTFGFFNSTSTTQGATGFGYSNGDGMLMYPGADTIYPSYNFHMDGGIASLRLKMVRRGIQDVDYLTQAYAVNPSSTTSIYNTVVQQALWEHNCFTLADCTYAYGGREWSETPDDWVKARERLAIIIAGATPATNHPSTFSGTNTLHGTTVSH